MMQHYPRLVLLFPFVFPLIDQVYLKRVLFIFLNLCYPFYDNYS